MTKIQQIKHQKSMDYWKQLVIAQQQSGLSVTEYCRQQDIKYNAFYYWLRKIREEALESLPQLPEKARQILSLPYCQQQPLRQPFRHNPHR